MPSTYNSVSTELDAINTMLATIGETPVNTLQGPLPVDVAIARNTLAETTREVQLEGWHFNSEEDFPLQVTGDGFIRLPPTVFRVTLSDPDSRDIVQRGSRLYDRAAHTFTFTEDINATVFRILAYEEMPEAFRWYVTVSAARKFQDRVVGSGELHGFNQVDESKARALAEREDMECSRPSLAKGRATSFISGWNVANVLAR